MTPDHPSPRIFLDALPWDLRSRNTDWRYLRYVLCQLHGYQPELTFVASSARSQTVRGNAKTLVAALARRLRMPLADRTLWTHTLSRPELNASGANVLVTQSFPTNAHGCPVVWQSAVLDPEMQQSYGVTPHTMHSEIEFKREFFARSAQVLQFTHAEVARHRRSFPESADKFFFAPFFTPHITPCDEAALDRHRNADPVRILFVGNNALRKGLPELLRAFQSLPAPVLRKAHLTILSNFDRSPISVPDNPRITVVRGAPSADVLRAMRESHILVNVAHFESYGVVFMEAMAQGMACLGPDFEVQREFFHGGTAGLNLRTDSTAIRIALEHLIEDEDLRLRIARAAWLRFQQCYAPAVAAARYRELFVSALDAAA